MALFTLLKFCHSKDFPVSFLVFSWIFLYSLIRNICLNQNKPLLNPFHGSLLHLCVFKDKNTSFFIPWATERGKKNLRNIGDLSGLDALIISVILFFFLFSLFFFFFFFKENIQSWVFLELFYQANDGLQHLLSLSSYGLPMQQASQSIERQCVRTRNRDLIQKTNSPRRWWAAGIRSIG